MKTTLPCLALVTGLFALPPATFAQGTAFTYQGRLNDGPNPASGTYDLRFAVQDAADGGAQLGNALTNAASAVSNGLFIVTLDFGNQFPGAPRWLEIAARTNGGGAFTTLSPRQQITSTPYAIASANAATAASVSGSVSATQLTGTISSNNIGAGSITTAMLAAGAMGPNQLASGSVTTGALADGTVTADKMTTVTLRLLLTTFTNPAPAANDQFGYSVAAVGTDRVLIGVAANDTGATDAGAAYLFSSSGTLLTLFTNPTPAASDLFGLSVAALGTDRVLIGARDDTGATDAGAAYLFSTNGALLTTFNNPTPAANERFGSSVAAVGTDRVLIAADGDNTGATGTGAAYLFNTNGALLTTFANPTPAANDEFGSSVAAVGTDRVLIGAMLDDTGATDAGTAYLFSTNGALLTTFSNPTPEFGDEFGSSVAAVGTDRVLIGAATDNTGASHAGAAYLFRTNGALLTTFTNPTPAILDVFGFPVAAVGTDGVLIGAYQDNTGAGNAGAAYLFSVETYTPALIADGVRRKSITTASLEDGAVTAAKIGGVLFADQIPDLDDAHLSTNVALLNASQMFTGTNSFKAVTVTDNGGTNASGLGRYFRDNSIIAWARVSSAGVIDAASSFGVASVSHPGAGVYELTLSVSASVPRSLIPVAIAEVDGAPFSSGTARLITIDQQDVNTFSVYISNGLFAPADNEFVLIVTGR